MVTARANPPARQRRSSSNFDIRAGGHSHRYQRRRRFTSISELKAIHFDIRAEGHPLGRRPMRRTVLGLTARHAYLSPQSSESQSAPGRLSIQVGIKRAGERKGMTMSQTGASTNHELERNRTMATHEPESTTNLSQPRALARQELYANKSFSQTRA